MKNKILTALIAFSVCFFVVLDYNLLTKADEVPTTLSNATGGNKTAIDFDAIMQSDWNKLPEDVRRQALMDASSGG